MTSFVHLDGAAAAAAAALLDVLHVQQSSPVSQLTDAMAKTLTLARSLEDGRVMALTSSASSRSRSDPLPVCPARIVMFERRISEGELPVAATQRRL